MTAQAPALGRLSGARFTSRGGREGAPSFAAGDCSLGLATGDLDGDGHADLVVASAARLHVLPGRGDGTLVSRLDVPSGYPLGRALVVDCTLVQTDDAAKIDVLFGCGGGVN